MKRNFIILTIVFLGACGRSPLSPSQVCESGSVCGELAPIAGIKQAGSLIAGNEGSQYLDLYIGSAYLDRIEAGSEKRIALEAGKHDLYFIGSDGSIRCHFPELLIEAGEQTIAYCD